MIRRRGRHALLVALNLYDFGLRGRQNSNDFFSHPPRLAKLLDRVRLLLCMLRRTIVGYQPLLEICVGQRIIFDTRMYRYQDLGVERRNFG